MRRSVNPSWRSLATEPCAVPSNRSISLTRNALPVRAGHLAALQ